MGPIRHIRLMGLVCLIDHIRHKGNPPTTIVFWPGLRHNTINKQTLSFSPQITVLFIRKQQTYSGIRKRTTSCSTIILYGPTGVFISLPSMLTMAWAASCTSTWRVR